MIYEKSPQMKDALRSIFNHCKPDYERDAFLIDSGRAEGGDNPGHPRQGHTRSEITKIEFIKML